MNFIKTTLTENAYTRNSYDFTTWKDYVMIFLYLHLTLDSVCQFKLFLLN